MITIVGGRRGPLRVASLLALMLSLLPCAGASGQTIAVTAGATPTTQVAVGAKLAVPILVDMSAAGGASIALLTTGLSWPFARLSFDSVTAGSFGGLTSNLTNVATGNAGFSASSGAGNTSTTSLATAYFTALANPGSARVQLIPSVAQALGGSSLLSLIQARVLDVCVMTQGIWGDANGDGSVNIIDAQQLARFSVGLAVSNSVAVQTFGDVNADAAVNIVDAQQVARFSVGLSAAPRVNTAYSVVPPVTSVSVAPPTSTINVGSAAQMTVTPLDAGANSIAGCVAVTYSSNDPSKASVSATGLVTGVAAGGVVITATAGGVSGTSAVTVNAVQVAVASVAVSPASGGATVGGTVQFSATPKDAGGNPLAGRVVTWGSSNAAIASVNGSGLASAIAAGGPVTITATSEGVNGTASMTVTAATGGSGLLRVSSVNGRYFVDGNGTPVYLVGSHTWADFQDQGVGDPPPVFNYTAFLDYLVARGHNFTKLWAYENERWNQDLAGDNFWTSPNVYLRTGPGLALDGKPKWDLNQFNPEYLDRLRQRIILAGQRGIYVSVMLFEGESIETAPNKPGTNPWLGHPYNASNNINGVNGDPNGDNLGLEAHRLVVPAVTAAQQAYIRRIVDLVNDLDNVVYEMSLEDSQGAQAWQQAMIVYLKGYEASKPKQHPVGMTALYPGGQNSDLFASAADWISPNGDLDTPAATGAKVILQDTDHLCGTCANRTWPWKNLTRGVNTLYMDPYDGALPYNNDPDRRADPPWEDTRYNMGMTLAYAKRMNLLAMTPRGDLSSTGYCLANPTGASAEFLVYQPNDASFTVDLSGASGTFIVEWYQTSDRQIIAGGTVQGGAVRSFAHLGNDAVLYLHR